jgi:sulfide dehydrogenase [flavocytochrome c] flavoprotein subunit
VANYFKQNKPKSKVIILDANEDVVSKKGLFTKAWTDLYKGIVEYRPNSEVKDVDAASKTAILEFDKFKADVLNVVPPHRAGDIAAKSGIKLINNRWVDIDWLIDGIHQHAGRACPGRRHLPGADHAEVRPHGQPARQACRRGHPQPAVRRQPPNPTPVLMNTCYSFVDAKNAIHVASVHQYDPATKVVQPVKGAGGVSAARNEIEGKVALGWAKNIWADMLA